MTIHTNVPALQPSVSEIAPETPSSGISASTFSSGDAPWWEEDIWHDPLRPFHYYGKGIDCRPGRPKAKEPTPKTEPDNDGAEESTAPDAPAKTESVPLSADPNDFSAFKTLESLKAEREKRLSVAIMNPTRDNMESYQAINAHVLALSARFAQAWQLGRLATPQYDFTSTHPSAAFAVTAMAENRNLERSRLMESLKGDIGLIFIGESASPMTPVAAGPAATFARTHGLDLLAVAAGQAFPEPLPGRSVEGFEAFETVMPDKGQMKRWGVSLLPALLLVPRPEAMAKRADLRRLRAGLNGRDGFILATGAVSAAEIERRIALLVGPDPEMTGIPHTALSPYADEIGTTLTDSSPLTDTIDTHGEKR